MRAPLAALATCAATACVAASAVLCVLAWREVRDVYFQLKQFD